MISLNDIRLARAVIGDRLFRTPMLPQPGLGDLAGVTLALKAELFQRTGSFKARGVLNKLAGLGPEERVRGVIGASAGNHAVALAFGASLEGIAATVVMPLNAPASKVAAARAYGAEVIQVGDTSIEMMRDYERLVVLRGQTPVHPFADPLVMAGQGTLALEILEDMPDLDAVLVGIGGGGLIGGVATAIKELAPRVRVVGVEPEGAPGMSRALAAGKVVRLNAVDTIAGGLAPPFVSDLGLAVAQRFVDDVVLVSDQEIQEAMVLMLEQAKLVAEPSGAAALAALLAGRGGIRSSARVAVVVSGGNIDRARLKSLL
ncbi:MAG TPA: threonine/serine dehydratase [Chloroflexota bacterium]